MERIGDASAEGRRQRLSLRGRGWWWVNRWSGGQCCVLKLEDRLSKELLVSEK